MRSALLLTATCLSLAACTWQGFKPVTEYTPVQAGVSCPSIGTQNLAAPDRRSILEAAAATCAIIHSEAFARELADRELRQDCKIDTRISGTDVVQMLRAGIPDHSIIAKKPWRADALTHPQNRRIAIRNQRFDSWRRGGEDAGSMINTIAHEWTHLYLDSEDKVKFADAGHTKERPGCPKSDLVSYSVGRAAQKVWKSQ